MQNKRFIKFLAISLALISIFYLSFTFVTIKYYKQAKKYSKGISYMEDLYLDSIASKKIWLGYSLKKCREMEINLGLDLKGGMNVIMEISASDILKTLSDNNPDPMFNQALIKATEIQNKKKNDFISAFATACKELDQNVKLSVFFNTYELREKIHPQSTNEEVISVLRTELKIAYDNSFNILRNRIDKFGVTAPNIQRIDKEGLISIELPGVKNPNRIRNLLQGTANLEFWETYLESDIHQILIIANNIIRDSLQLKLDSQGSKKVKVTSENLLYPLFSLLKLDPNKSHKNCIVTSIKKNDKKQIDAYFENSQVKNLLNTNRISLKWTVNPHTEESDLYDLIALKINYIDNKPKPILSGNVVQDATSFFSQNSHYSEINMTMKNEASKIWARLTRDNIGKSIAIVLDNLIYSYPIVNSEIIGGSSQITGNFTTEQAKDLANVLKSGKMAARAKIVKEEIIGPSLGKQAINRGFISFISAIIILMLYLIFTYSWKPGLIACGALILNLFFSLGIMVSFHVVLTLSGIAGIILALAFAVDANVLIYERIKEETRKENRMLKKVIEEGYKKAFSSILDANLTSFITGFILFVFGTGPVRGFAFTLMVGIIISFFTAVFLTHLVYEIFLEKKKLQNIYFTTKLLKNFLANPTFNFVKNLKLSYYTATIITFFCFAVFFLRGLNQGIDYTGGRNYIVKFNQIANTVKIQKLLKPYFGNNTLNITTIGASNQVRISTNYMIKSYLSEIDSIIHNKLYTGLKPLLPKVTTLEKFINNNIQSQQKVGPNIADNLKQKAVLAVGLAALAIGLYIFLRFRSFSYSIGSIISCSFDVLFILGSYSLLWGIIPFPLEIDQTFIGAILTVIGYSINDKIIIFDRIREFTFLYPKKSKLELFNSSINSVLDRTFNTSMSTLLTMLIIFCFGGESIRSFSFTMILGIIIGTFSSIFLAAPIACKIQLKN